MKVLKFILLGPHKATSYTITLIIILEKTK